VHRRNVSMIYILSNSDMFCLSNNHFQGAVKIIKIVHITEGNVHGIYTWIHWCATQFPINAASLDKKDMKYPNNIGELSILKCVYAYALTWLKFMLMLFFSYFIIIILKNSNYRFKYWNVFKTFGEIRVQKLHALLIKKRCSYFLAFCWPCVSVYLSQ